MVVLVTLVPEYSSPVVNDYLGIYLLFVAFHEGVHRHYHGDLHITCIEDKL